MQPELQFALLAFGLICVAGIGIAIVIRSFYHKVDQGQALVINRPNGRPRVSFSGAIVLPIIQRAEVMDISLKTIEIDRRGREGVICRDKIRADVQVTFYVRVNKTEEDVLRVASSIGCTRAGNPETLSQLFNAKFSGALKQVAAQLDFSELYSHRDQFQDQMLQVIGDDLNGYRLDDLAIDYLEQTPVDQLDPNNILDAQGIRKIQQITTAEKAATSKLLDEERVRLERQKLETEEQLQALEQRRAKLQSSDALGLNKPFPNSKDTEET